LTVQSLLADPDFVKHIKRTAVRYAPTSPTDREDYEQGAWLALAESPPANMFMARGVVSAAMSRARNKWLHGNRPKDRPGHVAYRDVCSSQGEQDDEEEHFRRLARRDIEKLLTDEIETKEEWSRGEPGRTNHFGDIDIDDVAIENLGWDG